MSLRIDALVFALVLLPSFASASPIVAGFGNSITCSTCNDGSYLSLLGDYLVPDPIIDDQGVPASLSDNLLARVGDWLDAGNTADVLILLPGTPDTYQAVGGWGDRDYDPLETLGNVESILDLVLGEGIPLILLTPPPVLEPCGGSAPLTCDQVDARLLDLSNRLGVLALAYEVPFLHLYAAFATDPRFGLPFGPDSLYRSDGLHPKLATGDALIASLLAPMIESAVHAPEPSTALMLGFGLLALAQRRRRP
jgi:lysophospholipase L1-like esterase